jgi:hypothetical protein
MVAVRSAEKPLVCVRAMAYEKNCIVDSACPQISNFPCEISV